MSLTRKDQRLITALRRAETRTQPWREYMPEAKTVFRRVTRAADALLAAAEAYDAERADDDPARAARDAAEAALLDTTSRVLAYVRSRARVDGADALGVVADPARVAEVEAFLAQYIPEGGVSQLGGGQSLLNNCRAVAAGLVRVGYAVQGEALAPLIDTFAAAYVRVEGESGELGAAQRTLDEARDEAMAARVAARAYTVFAAAWAPSLAIDVTVAFPVASSPAAPTDDADPAPQG